MEERGKGRKEGKGEVINLDSARNIYKYLSLFFFPLFFLVVTLVGLFQMAPSSKEPKKKVDTCYYFLRGTFWRRRGGESSTMSFSLAAV